MHKSARILSFVVALATLLSLVSPFAHLSTTFASTPSTGTLNAPSGNGTTSLTWQGGPFTIATPDPALCMSANCDDFALTVNVPAGYWATHVGNVTVEINWASSSNDF